MARDDELHSPTSDTKSSESGSSSHHDTKARASMGWQPVMQHRIFAIPELVDTVVENVVTLSQDRWQGRHRFSDMTLGSWDDLKALSLTSRTFRDPCLNAMWYCQTSLVPLLRSAAATSETFRLKSSNHHSVCCAHLSSSSSTDLNHVRRFAKGSWGLQTYVGCSIMALESSASPCLSHTCHWSLLWS